MVNEKEDRFFDIFESLIEKLMNTKTEERLSVVERKTGILWAVGKGIISILTAVLIGVLIALITKLI